MRLSQSFLKSLELFFHILRQTDLNLGPAWPADVCAEKNITSPIIQISPPDITKE